MGCGMSVDTNQPSTHLSSPQRQTNQQLGAGWTSTNNNNKPYPTDSSNNAGHSSPQKTTSPNQNIPNSSPKKSPTKMAEISKEQLLRYMELEKSINAYESQNVAQNLNMKWNELKMLNETYYKLSAELTRCKGVTEKEKNEFDNMMQPSVRAFFLDETAFNAQLSKEQEEYLEALNHQEIVQKEVETVAKQKETVELDVAALRKDANELQALYKAQDELLGLIFSGCYGSDLEALLESEYDMAVDKHQRIDAAKYRWQTSRLLLYYAYQQIGVAVDKWRTMMNIPSSNTAGIYELATETRNNLISCMQNINNAQRYLGNIDFPYCNPQEMKTLGTAVQNIYTDMQRPQRQAHALACYHVTYQRLYALLVWFDQVIDTRIDKDLKDASNDLNNKRKLLRVERVRLIQERLKEKGIALTVDLDSDGNLKDSESLETEIKAIQTDESIVKRPTWVQTTQTESLGSTTKLQLNDVKPPPKARIASEELENSFNHSQKALPEAPKLDELAPPPSADALFGQMGEIQQKHEDQMRQYLQAQEANKSRVQQGLQERLRERRSRKSRQDYYSSSVDTALKDSA